MDHSVSRAICSATRAFSARLCWKAVYAVKPSHTAAISVKVTVAC